jgi:hypothetical protein
MGFTIKGMLGLRSVVSPLQQGVISDAHVIRNHRTYGTPPRRQLGGNVRKFFKGILLSAFFSDVINLDNVCISYRVVVVYPII